MERALPNLKEIRISEFDEKLGDVSWYRMEEKNVARRRFLTVGAAGGFGGLGSAMAAGESTLPVTPSETAGPFYPVVMQKDRDFDLTRIEGQDGVAKGEALFIIGKVVDTEGNAIEDATVDLWQANAAGRYRHPHDSNPAPLDESFQGWAIVPSGSKGEFRFKTIRPGAYPASEGWSRPPHIHFKVSKRGYEELVTQMYFPESDLNQKDYLLQRKSEAEQKLMVAERIAGDRPSYRYQIVLAKL